MEGEQSFCKKLIWQEEGKEKIVMYGLVLRETESHLEFKTARKKYFLSKKFIIKIQDTNRIFIPQEVQP